MLASNIIKLDSNNSAPMITGAHFPAKSSDKAVIAAKSMMFAANSLFTRIVYTSGVLNFSRRASTHAHNVILVANPNPQLFGRNADTNTRRA